ncbi:integrin alpha-5 isoform X1 [Electrophorus electricus]|uniref:Integrin alpha-2 domain-containing protein n=1 Tax=Electrophorus electricus TaxID=8005 RepID=A0A4W4DW69_ELEEL|nr:integrin alpha-5 isoform X1 [Electrophorus electricus]
MGSRRHRAKAAAASLRTGGCLPALLIAVLSSLCAAFNLDVERPSTYSGPGGSYFGYSVDFYGTNSPSSVSVIVGAPKGNTSQYSIREGGAVFYCLWSPHQTHCNSIAFDQQGDLNMTLNDTEVQAEFKSHQWFGATVRAHGDTVLACAPLYSWRTKQDMPEAEVTGSCYMSVRNFTKFVEYAPCRTEFHDRTGQGYCQGGFSADFTKEGKVVLGGPGSYFWQGQLISAVKEEIVRAYYPGFFLTSVKGQIETKQKKQINFDDNYMGYSVAVGEFSGDDDEEFVTGVPRGVRLHGQVSILNSSLETLKNLTGEQMGSYFGYAVSATDINNDGLTDLLVGAPMFMVRDSDGRLEELGRVYVYLQTGPLELEPQTPHLTGTQTFGRFGSSIASLGDLNQDGFTDVAIGSPFGGKEEQGMVFIYNGYAKGLREKASQVIAGQWASAAPPALPASFGFALRGDKDIDHNGYPDLIVGAFGVDKVVLYRSRPIVNTSATLSVYPTMINPEEKVCTISNGNQTMHVSCVNLSFCFSANGKHLPEKLAFNVEVQLDRLKQKQKGAVRRALFLDTQQASLQRKLHVPTDGKLCHETKIYLRDEKEFRDKLSSIFIALNFSLDPEAAADQHGLQPILNYQTAQVIEQKAQILLDCGEDNICVPDLKLSVHGDRKEVYMGDDNSLTLTFNARNDGGGAYEAELYVVLPPEADYSGIARKNESLTQLTCSYETENQTRYLSCDLGNPMKSGTNLWAGLRFTVPRLRDSGKVVQFDLQIRSKNENNSQSEVVPYKLEVVVKADVILQGVSRPDKVFFPPPNWKTSKNVAMEQEVGPPVEHIYELVNNGPSHISHTLLQLQCPMGVQGQKLMYLLEVTTEGPVNCTTHSVVNPMGLKLQQSSTARPSVPNQSHHIEKRETQRGEQTQLNNLSCSSVECWTLQCDVGLLKKGTSAILHVRSRIWAEMFMTKMYKNFILECLSSYKVEKMPYTILPKENPTGAKKVVTHVVWNKPDSHYDVPLWIIVLAIVTGLLLLSLLIYILYKLGFFKRTQYGTAMEKAQLKPQAASEA